MAMLEKPYRSNEMVGGLNNAGNRTLLYALGIDEDELKKPFIGIVNSWNEMHPGHKHLRELSAAVKEGIIAEGGRPFEFNTISICDGCTQGHDGMPSHSCAGLSFLTRSMISSGISSGSS